jgi:hypothetical protein
MKYYGNKHLSSKNTDIKNMNVKPEHRLRHILKKAPPRASAGLDHHATADGRFLPAKWQKVT